MWYDEGLNALINQLYRSSTVFIQKQYMLFSFFTPENNESRKKTMPSFPKRGGGEGEASVGWLEQVGGGWSPLTPSLSLPCICSLLLEGPV